jgi:CheY-like chemotaxis protein
MARILLAEDNDTARIQATFELEDAGYQVISAGNATRAFQMFEHHFKRKPLDIVLTDGQIGPEQDKQETGIVLIRKIREISAVPIIGCSSQTGFWDELKDGNFHSIPKKMDIANHLMRWNTPAVLVHIKALGF